MANSLRTMAGKSRNRILGPLMRELAGLGGQLNEIHNSQLEINHNTSVLLDELDKRTKNSGSVYLSEREMATKLFSGLKLYVDPQDLTLGVHLALDSIWESDITSAWLNVLKDGDVVVDIGANYGYYGALAAQKIFNSKDSQFIFFEANPYLMPYIRRTMAANWLIDKCKIENLAVSDKKGHVDLTVSPYYLGNASLSDVNKGDAYDSYRINSEDMEVKRVAATSIDGYCEERGIKRVSLIKMDIEGHEQAAYQGMRKTIKNNSDISLFIEFTREGYKNPKKFYQQLLDDFGYVYKIESGGRIVKLKDTSYHNVIESSEGWVMPLFSKSSKLATK
jgi:FkbM family methyltransferase